MVDLKILKNSKPVEIFLFLTIGVIIIAALNNFLNFRSLWLDEAMLALNFKNRNVLELLKPLSAGQVAPIGFVMVEKLMFVLFNKTDWSLRIFPFLCYLSSIPLLYRLCLKLDITKTVSLLICVVFSMNYYILNFSIEIKQYITDVVMCLLLLNCTLNYQKLTAKKSLVIYSLVCAIAIWFSNISVIILFVSLLYLVVTQKNTNKSQLYFTLPLVFCGISFLIYYYFFIHNHQSRNLMMEYWSKVNAFLPYNVLTIEFYHILIRKIVMVFKLILVNHFSVGNNILVGLVGIVASIVMGGIISRIKDYRITILIVAPIIVHLLLSYFKLYPFHTRLILYLLPLILVLLGLGLTKFYQFSKRMPGLKIIVLITLLYSTYSSLSRLPIEKEEMKDVLGYLESYMEPNSNLYVYSYAQPAFNFYRNEYKVDDRANHITYGQYGRSGREIYNEEISKFNDRVWLLFSHSDILKNNITDEDYILQQAKNQGYKIRNERIFPGSALYLICKNCD